jgi:hypothetical protein
MAGLSGGPSFLLSGLHGDGGRSAGRVLPSARVRPLWAPLSAIARPREAVGATAAASRPERHERARYALPADAWPPDHVAAGAAAGGSGGGGGGESGDGGSSGNSRAAMSTRLEVRKDPCDSSPVVGFLEPRSFAAPRDAVDATRVGSWLKLGPAACARLAPPAAGGGGGPVAEGWCHMRRGAFAGPSAFTVVLTTDPPRAPFEDSRGRRIAFAAQ